MTDLPRNPTVWECVRHCKRCPNLGKKHVAATGHPYARVMVVTQNPTEKDEWENGIAVCGQYGDMFKFIADQAEMDREEWYFTCLVKCRPETKEHDSRPPTVEEIQACYEEWWQGEFNSVKPEVVLVVGKEAWKFLVPEGVDEEKGHTGYRHFNTIAKEGAQFVCCWDPRFFTSSDDLSPFVALGDYVRDLLDVQGRVSS